MDIVSVNERDGRTGWLADTKEGFCNKLPNVVIRWKKTLNSDVLKNKSVEGKQTKKIAE